MAGSNDFYLNFGSNADPFAKDLAAELGPGIRQITALTEAIIRYDETVGDLSSSNPLGGLFSNLDNVSAKLESIGKDLSGTFGRITDSLGVLTRELQSALQSVDRAAGASRKATSRKREEFDDLADISPAEAQRRAEALRRRPAATQVSDDELSPAKQRQNQSTLAKARSDGDAARNAVKRVADINATLARNANESADALKNLGQSIRTLTTQTKTTDRGVTEGRFQQNVIQVQGGAVPGALANLDAGAVNRLLASAGIAEPAQAPARDEAHAAQRQAQAEAEAERRSRRILTPAQFSDPAQPGRYEVPGEKQPRTVSRTIPNETFEQYFQRVASNAQGLNQIRQDVQSASENRVGIQQSRDLQRIQQLIGRRGLEQLSGDEKLRNLNQLPGTVASETIRASVGSVLSPGQSLTPAQYAQVPEALAEFQKMQADFARFSRGDITRRLSANPLETFSFPRERDRKDVFGTQRDYREQVAEYDRVNEPEGAGFRERTEADIRDAMQRKSDVSAAYREFSARNEPPPAPRRDASGNLIPQGRYVPEDGSTYRVPRPVVGNRGDLDRNNTEPDSTADYDAYVEQAKAEARAQRQAAQAAQQFPEGSLPRAQSDAAAVQQRVEAAAQKLSASEERHAESEGEAAESAIQLSRAERRYASALLRYAQILDEGGSPSDARAVKAEQRVQEREARLSPQQLAHVSELSDAQLNAAIAAGGGKPPTPPRPPAPPAAASGDEEPSESTPPRATRTPRPRVAGTPFPLTDNVRAFEESLQQATREVLSDARQKLTTQTGIERQNTIERAGTALRNDPAFGSLGGLSQQRVALGTLLQLPRGGATNNALSTVFGRGSSGSASLGAASGTDQSIKDAAAKEKEAQATADSAAQYRRYIAAVESAAGASAAVQRATLAEYVAGERVHSILNQEIIDYAKLAAAQRELVGAQEGSRSAQLAENPNLQQQLFGQKGFGASQLRHIGLGLENTIGYTLVFEGLDKLKELVHNGLEAQVAFARLQASLTANGIAAGDLRQQFQGISAQTATPLEHVIEAASELSGTLRTTSDIAFGANIAAQLANISQGTLTAKDAAVALRDVVAAYGDQWEQTGISVHQGIQQSGDDIAHLSQLTGVNVKDIAEGTSQVASEARDFGLSQRTASTIAAYVTQGTGQTGEQAASQTTRLISGLYNTRTQEALQRVLKPTGGTTIQQQFATGDIGGVLTELIQQYGTLNDSSKQYIANLIGTGITARAFAALIGGGSNAVKALNGNFSDFGALQQQNQSYLEAISGRIKQLDEDFQNFGSTLQQLGAFDFLGGLAESLDTAFRLANFLFGKLEQFAHANFFGLPTEQALHLTTTLLEAAAAYRLFGGFAVRGALGTSLGSRLIGGVGAVNQAEINAAAAAGGEIPRARYRFRDVAGQFGTNARNRFRLADDAAGAGATEQTSVRSLNDREIESNTASLANMNQGLLSTTEALGALTESARAAALGEDSVAAASQAAAEAQLTNAATGAAGAGGIAAAANEANAAGAAEGVALGSSGITKYTDANGVVRYRNGSGQFVSRDVGRAAEAEANTSNGIRREVQSNGRTVYRDTGTGRLVSRQVASEAGFLEDGTIAAAGAGAVGAAGAAGAARVGLGARLGAAASGGILPVAAAIGVGLYGYSQIKAANNDFKTQDQAADAILSGDTSDAARTALQNRTGVAGFRDYYLGGPLGHSIPGELGNAVIHSGAGLVNILAGRQVLGGGNSTGASDESSNRELALNQRVFDRGVVGRLPELKSAQAIEEFEKHALASIESQRDAIQQAGGNDKQAQAQIAYNINQLERNVKTAAENRLKAIQGLDAIDRLNSQQIDDLQSALGSVSALNVNTLSKQAGAVQTLIGSGTLNPGSKAYRDLEQAAGLNQALPRAYRPNQIGVNEKGEYGYYDAKGQFYSSLNPVTETAGPAPGQTARRVFNPRTAPTQNARTESTAQRLRALSEGYEQSIKNANAILQSAGKPGGATDAAIQKAQQQLQTGLTGYQQIQDQIYQDPIQAAQGRATFATSFAGAAGQSAGLGLPTGTNAAVAATRQQVQALQRYGNTLAKDSPEYFQNLLAIAQAKQSIVQTLAAPELARLAVESASTSDAVTKANLQLQSARTQLGADRGGGASVQQIGQDRASVAAARIAQQQAGQAVTSARFQLQATQNRNSISKAQVQLNQALQAEAVYRQGRLADQAALLQAESQEVQARQAISDAIEAQREGAIEDRAALAKYQGRDVAAATDELAKARAAYAYAIQQYGRQSVEAQQAFANVLSARTDVNSAVTTQITSGLDLEIAQLNARGQSGDAQRAANVSLQKARVALNRYLKEGGAKGTATYNQLYGAVVTAQRTAFDTGLQAQLDTLDFQQQTYRITGAQEIAALQQILKNKQLTLAEQRSITLKIKGLQDNIRQQLTSGGLNIPSDIRLPTAYDVRRSLGAGFTGSRTNTAVVNNNQRAVITVNQTLPNKAVARAVANEVVDMINKQTGQQVRANSSTPRNVAVGRAR